eukprot:CAMPEP_0171530572 /NCGR_PEP_ID=MMETSP0959-20130129/13191_1 /TAXON_ID=87120 /ORGANISM="Aurantiochytrium limacinum, Strain ATCCMYA-1381" /LENGTH=106 /DNA_ID=CAMNT_0012073457 /DNA_START=44 /DNA_END=364 /DNA_ORIENTATION=-
MAETSAAPASLEGCLPELVNALACTKWLGRYVEGAFGMDAFEAGLFRVRASDATVDRLRRIMKYPEGLPYQKISLFLEENRAEKVSKPDSPKWLLRNGALAFTACN